MHMIHINCRGASHHTNLGTNLSGLSGLGYGEKETP